MRFRVKGVKGSQRVVTIELDALSEHDAILQASKQGYAALSVRKQYNAAKWRNISRGRFSVLPFSQELLALLHAGLPLLEALETLAEKEQNTTLGKVLQAIIEHLHQGRSLSYALRHAPETIPPLYVASVRASEKTGDLPEALTRYIHYQTQMDQVRGKFLSASIYPIFLLTVGTLVTLFLMMYVVPKFSQIYGDIGSGHIPFTSRMLFDWGDLVELHASAILSSIVAALVTLGYAVSRVRTREWLGKMLWAAPVIGERLRIYQLARFYHTLGMLLRGGTPVVTAIDMASGMLPVALRDSLRAASQEIQGGHNISEAMLSQNLTTPVAFRMLRVGERSGTMGTMTEQIASFYDGEIARWLDWFMRLFEPLLMTIIGLVVGGIIILMYMPIFDLAGSLQ